MNLELRLAALSALLPATTEAVENKLLTELDNVERVLQTSAEYDELAAALKVLSVLAPRFSFRVIPMLTAFVRAVPNRVLTRSGEPIEAMRNKYRSAGQLIRDAIDVPHSIRLLHLTELLDFLFELWASEDTEVKSKADRTLESLAAFDMNTFYGEHGLGAGPQNEIVAYLAKMQDRTLFDRASIALKLLRNSLAPSIDGHNWSYNSVNIRRGGIQADGGVAEMREAAISLLKRMYAINCDLYYRKQVLSTLNAATRREYSSANADTSAMFDRDATTVLNFLRDQVPQEELQLILTIEHDAYWSYYHAASTLVADAALEVRDAIERRHDYLIYKDLIGFEGIHGPWEELKRSESAWDYTDDRRRKAAKRYLEAITDDTEDEWRDRILEFSKTRSDDMAMFPVFYDFLKSIGQSRPQLALELLKYEDRMRPFLIALLRGLWSSERQDDAEKIAEKLMKERTELSAVAKSLNVDENPRLDLLVKVMDEADRVNDQAGADAIVQAMGVAGRQYALGNVEAKEIFLKGVRMMAMRQDARWANVIWFDRDFRRLVEAMEPNERIEVLKSLAPLKKLDYQAENLLSAIGKYEPQAVLEFLMTRVRDEQARTNARPDTTWDEEEDFEAIPYGLHSLDKVLVTIPSALVRAVRDEFKVENAGMFPYSGGALLIKAVFPTFDQLLQEELLQFIKSGSTDDIEFAVTVLRAYGGSAQILGICKEIIKVVPEKSSVWSEVAAAFESTGIVSGEYGLVQALELKRDQIAPWKNDENRQVRMFSTWLIESLDEMIRVERQRADDSLAVRKHRYGMGGESESE